MKLKILIIFSFFTIFSNCKQPDCPDIYLGEFLLQWESKQYIPPYSNQEKIIFQNDVGEEITLSPFQVHEGIFEYKYEKSCQGNTEESYYLLNKERFHYSFRDDENDWWLLFRSFVYTVPPEYQDIQNDTINFDYFYMRMGSIVDEQFNDFDQITFKSNFDRDTDIPDSFQEIYDTLKVSYEILEVFEVNGIVYNDVFKYENQGNTVYFVKGIGLLRFEIDDRGIWSFNRFESI